MERLRFISCAYAHNLLRVTMKLKTVLLTAVCLLGIITANCQEQTKISILGDSYSTFRGHIYPEYNACWFGNIHKSEAQKTNDVSSVDQTWWSILLKKMDAKMIRNNSYSGATICHTGYKKEDYSDRSFVSRMHNLGNPDVIFIFGGTNDFWAESPMGEDQYDNWTRDDLFKFRPAFCYLLHHMKALYPKARIYNVVNTELGDIVPKAMDEICKHYGIHNIQLEELDKQGGHPSIKGMQMIADQIYEHLK